MNFPASYVGDYLYADYCGGYVKSIDLSTGQAGAVTTLATNLSFPVDLKTGPDGAVYVLNIGNGTVARFQNATSLAPQITQAPANTLVAIGQPAAFSVAASGAAPLTYQWQRNGVDIPGAAGSSFTLPATTAADEGATFRVVVSNSAGTVTSALQQRSASPRPARPLSR